MTRLLARLREWWEDRCDLYVARRAIREAERDGTITLAELREELGL